MLSGHTDENLFSLFQLLRQQKPNQSERRRESRSERRTKNYRYKRNIRFKRRKKEKSNSDEQKGFLRQCERRKSNSVFIEKQNSKTSCVSGSQCGWCFLKPFKCSQ